MTYRDDDQSTSPNPPHAMIGGPQPHDALMVPTNGQPATRPGVADRTPHRPPRTCSAAAWTSTGSSTACVGVDLGGRHGVGRRCRFCHCAMVYLPRIVFGGRAVSSGKQRTDADRFHARQRYARLRHFAEDAIGSIEEPLSCCKPRLRGPGISQPQRAGWRERSGAVVDRQAQRYVLNRIAKFSALRFPATKIRKIFASWSMRSPRRIRIQSCSTKIKSDWSLGMRSPEA